MALRFCASIMEVSESLSEDGGPPQKPCGEQVALGQERRALEPWIPALADDAEHGLGSEFEILKEDALELGAGIGIAGSVLDLPQGQAEVAGEDLGAKGLRPPEEAVGQAFDLADTEFFPPECVDEGIEVARTKLR